MTASPGARWRARVLAVLALSLAACASAPEAGPTAGPIVIAATEAALPVARALAQGYQLARPEAVFDLRLEPQAALAEELASGRAAVAFTAQAPAGWFATPVGALAWAVVVQADNPVTALSQAQVRALFAGQAADWSQVGGAAGPVQVVVRPAGCDDALAFSRALAAGPPSSPNALVAPTLAAMRALVAETPAAVGWLPANALDPGVKAVALDAPLLSDILASAPAEPAGPARDFLAWAQSPAGQAAAAPALQPPP